MVLVMVLGRSSTYMKVRSSLLALKFFYNSEEFVFTQIFKLDIIFLIPRHHILLCSNFFNVRGTVHR